MMWICLFLLFSLFLLIQSVIIDTPLGSIRGAPSKANNGKKVYAFKKVPFASPPVGDLRFELPQKPLPWKGVWDATRYGPACLSNSTVTSSPQKWVDEDCLHLNIFTSQKCLKSSCPVVYYLHGGGFNYDSAVMFNDEYLINKFAAEDVVLIVAAFRLGFFGLLSFANDDVVHRNLPVYDIIRGLEFTQDYIRYFGGNPGSVTMLGHSGGGAAVLALSLSKTIDPEQKLFQRGIAMSGPIGAIDELSLREISWEFVYRMGCTYVPRPGMVSENFIRETIDCLRLKDQMELLRVQRTMEEENLPVPQGIVLTKPLFEEELQNSFENPPPRSIMMGSNTLEMDTYSTTDYSVIVADLFGYSNPQKIAASYKKDVEKGVLAFNHVTETQLVYTGNQLCAEAITKSGAPVYLYSYQNRRHPEHTDDLFYLLGVHPYEMDENEKELSVIYPELFLNFCRTGKPNEDFEPYNIERQNFYYVDVDLKTGLRPHNQDHYQKEVIEYWTKTAADMDERFNKMRNLNKKDHPTIERKTIAVKGADSNSANVSSTTEASSTTLSISTALTSYYLGYYWYLSQFCIVLFFSAAGYLLGCYQAKSDHKTHYLRLDGVSTEKTPLFT